MKTSMLNLTAKEIMQRIKTEVEKRKTNSQYSENIEPKDVVAKCGFEIKQDKEDVVFSTFDNSFEQKEVYEYADFTKYHDKDFITNLYRIILKREPDADGLSHYLNQLRTGEKSKSELISIVRYSKEGKEKNVKILGSKKRYILAALYSKPFIGHIAKSFMTLFRLPNVLKRLNSYENYVNQLHQISIDNDMRLQNLLNNKSDIRIIKDLSAFVATKAEQKELESKLENLESKLNSKAEQKELELYLQAVAYAKEYMKISQQNMQNLIDEAKKRLPEEVLNQNELLAISDEEKHIFDTFYVEFEDKFRGTREDIKERVKVYLPYIEKLPFDKKDMIFLDVGCGRGEWLELLKEEGYENTKGLDLNRVMVAKSQELGLDVIESDVIEYLVSLPDNSLSVITGFHIIEHLPFEVLMRLFKESYRVLKRGGIVIFETPNSENLLVGAHYFYSDPTHISPLVPFSVQFMIEQNGFVNNEIKRLHKYSDYFDAEPQNKFLSNVLYNEMDFAIIGYKL